MRDMQTAGCKPATRLQALEGVRVLPQAVAVLNGKGGSGKTSLTANLGGLLAGAGYRVLLVDLDAQGNLATDLGYTAISDGGGGLLRAVTGGGSLCPLPSVRPNLDVVCGGPQLDDLTGLLAARQLRRGEVPGPVLESCLKPITRNYHAVLFDCPPSNPLLHHLALTAAHFLLIPTKADEASLDGLAAVAERFTEVRAAANSRLELLGVVLFDVGSASRKIRERARKTIAKDLGDPQLVFNAWIRHLEGPAVDCRRLGKLAHELEQAVASAPKFWERLRSKTQGQAVTANDEVLSTTAPRLASDYGELALEFSERFSRRLIEEKTA